MANRYWVGATGTWNATAGTKWATTSGGAGGAAVPTSADDVYIDQTNDFCTIEAGYAASCNNFTLSGSSAYINAVGDTSSLTVSGNLNVNSGTNWALSCSVILTGAGGRTITNSGASSWTLTTLTTTSGTTNLGSDFNVRGITFSGGGLTTNNYAVSSSTIRTSGSSAITLALGSSAVTLTGARSTEGDTPIQFASSGGTTVTGTATITINGTATCPTPAIDFGGATVYNIVLANSAATSYSFTGDVTATSISSSRSGTYTVNIAAAKTVTTTSWTISGTAGNVVTLKGQTAGVFGYIAKAGGGTVTVDYMTIKDLSASPAVTWLATNSTNGGNNVNWSFGTFAAPIGSLFFGSTF